MDINDFESLISRLDDLKRCATRGSLGVSAFFSPRELRTAEEYLCSCGAAFLLYGGYEDSERELIFSPNLQRIAGARRSFRNTDILPRLRLF